MRSRTTPLCMIYEWDHAANVERITQSTKTFYRRKARYFKLYKSTVAVIAPPKASRWSLKMLPVMFIVAGFFAWNATARWRNPQTPAGAVAASSSSASASAAKSSAVPAVVRAHPEFAGVPKLGGCYSVGEACSCMEPDGRRVRVEQWMCKLSAEGFEGLVRWEMRASQPVSVPAYGAAAPLSSEPARLPGNPVL